ncbi:MAG: hypothetical protein LBT23_09085 [Synergistaceae bacterium]|jgi:hypothetical protein|nr:hypothetical protein [Synergistaceae bacterium]
MVVGAFHGVGYKDEYSAAHSLEYLLNQAKEEARADVARNLLKKGINTETIIQALGLSGEDIEKLR